ncbi:hypothetical protein, partial [Pseudomonas tohonis]|uniref:hypothetical protein n=1 Tax=Pseudomonas tohonis TaxID=2725477 RepID=UPI001F1F49E7
MSDVKRYEPFGRDGLSNVMHEDALGSYVFYDHYEAKRKGWAEQHSRDSKELRELCQARDDARKERDRLQRNLDFTEQWYAVRFERLADLGKSAGCWDAMAAIIANGTADQYEPPTYAQQLVLANHRADVAERERDQL